MKLFHNPASPFVRMVCVTLHETDQMQDVSLVPTATTPYVPSAPLAGVNPLAKIPALERPDGCTLYDSRVICQFLDDRAKAGLYPQGQRRWEVLTLEATGHGLTEAVLAMTYESRRPEDRQFPDFVDAQWTKAARACAALEARWLGHLSGPLDAGQIAVACGLGYIDFRQGDRDWRSANPGLDEWYARFAQRSSMQETMPAG